MSRPDRPKPRELVLCIRCRRFTFDPLVRDVSDWPFIDDPPPDASDHCERCWMELVVYTRPRTQQILRVRECRHCGRRIVTREKLG